MVFTQLVVNSLIIGSIYALVACGFSLIYATNKFMHFAHGASVVVGGYLLYAFFTQLHLPFSIACILTIIGSGLLGLLMQFLIYRPLQKKKASNVILLIASIGLLIIMENVIQIIFGASVKSIGYIEVAEGHNVLGAAITPLQGLIIIISVALMILLYLLLKKTKLGRNMRAVADNKELASIVGVNEKIISAYSFFLGSVQCH